MFFYTQIGLLNGRAPVELTANSRLLVVLSAGRNEISNASIRLSGPSGITFDYSKAVLDGERMSVFASFFDLPLRGNGSENAQLSHAQDCISLNNVKSEDIISILLPHSDATTFHAMVRGRFI